MANHRRSLEKEAQWRGHIRQQAGSGVSIRQYCRDRQLSEASFYVWRRKLAKRDGQQDQQATLDAAASTRPAGHGGPRKLVALDVIDIPADAKLEIDLPGGVVIRLRECVATDTLERVLRVACDQQNPVSARHRSAASC
jgi:transposase-like protein